MAQPGRFQRRQQQRQRAEGEHARPGAGLREACAEFEARHDFKEVIVVIIQQLGRQRERKPNVGWFAEEERSKIDKRLCPNPIFSSSEK